MYPSLPAMFFHTQPVAIMYIFVSLVLVVLLTAFHFLQPPHRRLPFPNGRYVMPPGPKGLPLFGNLVGWLEARNGGGMVPWVSEPWDSRSIKLPTFFTC